MTAELLKQTEALPEDYPAAPEGLSTAAAALDPAMIWQRIESYVAYRWTPRAVVWTVQGPGDWCPNLGPLEVTAEEVWRDDTWATATVFASPLGGYRMTTAEVYRFTGTVGAGEPPPAVLEAFKRLAEYWAGARDSTDEPGATTSKMKIGGAIDFEVTRNPAWIARAMQYSGAGDLLRPYRRV